MPRNGVFKNLEGRDRSKAIFIEKKPPVLETKFLQAAVFGEK